MPLKTLGSRRLVRQTALGLRVQHDSLGSRVQHDLRSSNIPQFSKTVVLPANRGERF